MKKNNELREEECEREEEYEKMVKKKLDKIIEHTSNENNALKKILESLNKPAEKDKGKDKS